MGRFRISRERRRCGSRACRSSFGSNRSQDQAVSSSRPRWQRLRTASGSAPLSGGLRSRSWRPGWPWRKPNATCPTAISGSWRRSRPPPACWPPRPSPKSGRAWPRSPSTSPRSAGSWAARLAPARTFRTRCARREAASRSAPRRPAFRRSVPRQPTRPTSTPSRRRHRARRDGFSAMLARDLRQIEVLRRLSGQAPLGRWMENFVSGVATK